MIESILVQKSSVDLKEREAIALNLGGSMSLKF